MEHGNCTSGVDHEIVNMHAAQLFQWKKIIADGNEYLRDQLLDCEEPDEAPFECPECGDRFYKLSSLVQHVDSYACDCELDERPMVQLMGWLRKKLWSYWSIQWWLSDWSAIQRTVEDCAVGYDGFKRLTDEVIGAFVFKGLESLLCEIGIRWCNQR